MIPAGLHHAAVLVSLGMLAAGAVGFVAGAVYEAIRLDGSQDQRRIVRALRAQVRQLRDQTPVHLHLDLDEAQPVALHIVRPQLPTPGAGRAS